MVVTMLAICDVTGGMQMASPEALRVESEACSSLSSGETSPLPTKMTVRRTLYLENLLRVPLPKPGFHLPWVLLKCNIVGCRYKPGQQNDEKIHRANGHAEDFCISHA